MINLWYINTKTIDQYVFNEFLEIVPEAVQKDVKQYRFLKDQTQKLFGKLLVEKYYREHALDFCWSKWKNEVSGKPFLIDGKKFNITHSGNFVLVAFSDQEIGVDLEEVVGIDLESVISNLHPLEKEYILNSSLGLNSFYEVWTRKEAFLKAIGKGVVNGLHHENCLEDFIILQQPWFIKSIPFNEKHKLALCTPVNRCQITIKELSIKDFVTAYSI